jgi:hypothetical protein
MLPGEDTLGTLCKPLPVPNLMSLLEASWCIRTVPRAVDSPG